MPRCVALLRAVNLGPHNKVSMSELRDIAAQLELANAQTVLQSGNLVFEDRRRRTPRQIERLLEAAVASRCRVSTDIFVRTSEEWAAIIAANPFPSEAKRDPSHLVVSCGRDVIPAARVQALQRAIVGRETVRASSRELYVYYPDGIGGSRLTAAVIQKHLGAGAGTGRNWNTVARIEAMLRGSD